MSEEYIDKLLDCIIKTKNSALVTVGWCSDYYIDTSHLDDKDNMTLIIMLYNMEEYGCKKKHLKKIFPCWTDYKIRKIAKELNVDIVTMWSDDGYLSGKGYMFKLEDVNKFTDKYRLRFNKKM